MAGTIGSDGGTCPGMRISEQRSSAQGWASKWTSSCRQANQFVVTQDRRSCAKPPHLANVSVWRRQSSAFTVQSVRNYGYCGRHFQASLSGYKSLSIEVAEMSARASRRTRVLRVLPSAQARLRYPSRVSVLRQRNRFAKHSSLALVKLPPTSRMVPTRWVG